MPHRGGVADHFAQLTRRAHDHERRWRRIEGCELFSYLQNDRAVNLVVVYEFALESKIDFLFVDCCILKNLTDPVFNRVSIVWT